jgi:MoaA/NifB/PqqE/SkfB family radical SAM enzyme
MCKEIVDYGVTCIKFSIDAGTAPTYKHIRGGDFSKVMGGISTIAKLKKSMGREYPLMDFNFLAMRNNVAELPRLLRLAAGMGIRAINVFYPTIQKEELVPESLYFYQDYSDEVLLAAQEIAQSLGVGLMLPALFRNAPAPGSEEVVAARAACLDPWSKLLVNVDGSAQLCCGGPTVIGNLKTQSFDEMWNGPVARALRKTLNTPQEPSYCKLCGVRRGNPREPGFHLKTPQLLEKYANASFQ